MFGLVPIASGSKGNAFLLLTPTCNILIDAGISGRSLKERLDQFSFDLENLDAIFVTHEHSDHILGLKVLAKKYQIPVICNHETARALVDYLGFSPEFKIFSTGEPFIYKELEILPFSVPHDAMDPVAFAIHIPRLGKRIGICTDLGFAPPHLLNALANCHVLVLESNHEPDLVLESKRPQVYKQRVLSRSGHLSNDDCCSLITKLYHQDLSHIVLAHLSSECNDAEKALQKAKRTVRKYVPSCEVLIAQQDNIGSLISLSEDELAKQS